MRNAPDIRVFLFPTKRYIRLKTQHNNQTSSPCLRACVCVWVCICVSVARVMLVLLCLLLLLLLLLRLLIIYVAKQKKMNKTKCISHSVFGFWCFHARAASHAPKYCATAAALLLLLLAALSFWDFRCAFCCAPAATAALSSLSPCQHSVSLSLSCCSLSHAALPCTLFICVREPVLSVQPFSRQIWVFSNSDRGKKSKNCTI